MHSLRKEQYPVPPVLNSENSEAWEQTALSTETFLKYNKLRARRIPDHAIKLKNSVDIISAFFTQITASISSDTLKHIIGLSGNRSTPAPETVAVRKNNFAIPLPVPPLGLFKSFVGLVFLASIFILFLAFRAVSILIFIF